MEHTGKELKIIKTNPIRNVNQINDLIGLRREWTQLKRVYELETTLKEHVLITEKQKVIRNNEIRSMSVHAQLFSHV